MSLMAAERTEHGNLRLHDLGKRGEKGIVVVVVEEEREERRERKGSVY